MKTDQILPLIYNELLAEYDFQNWWPGETLLEIVVGALLTQNTNWTNVERAIVNIHQKAEMKLEVLIEMPLEELEEAIRPSGFYKQKAGRLKNLLIFLRGLGWNGKNFLNIEPETFRNMLLSQKGIGRETADSILCYAFDLPFFVVDAYTKRLAERIGLGQHSDYEKIRALFENVIKDDFEGKLSIYKDFHAQIVMHAKQHCRKKPICEGCPLRKKGICNFSR